MTVNNTVSTVADFVHQRDRGGVLVIQSRLAENNRGLAIHHGKHAVPWNVVVCNKPVFNVLYVGDQTCFLQVLQTIGDTRVLNEFCQRGWLGLERVTVVVFPLLASS